MRNNNLMTGDYGVNGVYRCKLLIDPNTNEIRTYVPGINNINPLNEDGSINLDIYQKHIECFPPVQWCCYNLESKEFSNQDPLNWCMFENGDFRKPVVISYAVIGGDGSGGYSGSGGSYGSGGGGSSSGGSGSGTTSGGSNIDYVPSGDASGVAEKAVALACSIANDDSHKYAYGSRGPTNFDCSGFVWYCYNNSNGGGLSNLTYASTGAMLSTYTNAGFKNVTSSINLSTGEGLITGDILLNSSGGHVDMYAGGGKRVGAHSSKTGIYVDNYGYNQKGYNNKYNYVLRYGG